MRLCTNCLETGGQDRQIGPEQGPQRDPSRQYICLCAVCWECLYNSRLHEFSDRYKESRMITR